MYTTCAHITQRGRETCTQPVHTSQREREGVTDVAEIQGERGGNVRWGTKPVTDNIQVSASSCF